VIQPVTGVDARVKQAAGKDTVGNSGGDIHDDLDVGKAPSGSVAKIPDDGEGLLTSCLNGLPHKVLAA